MHDALCTMHYALQAMQFILRAAHCALHLRREPVGNFQPCLANGRERREQVFGAD
jgi:hypothetical protein